MPGMLALESGPAPAAQQAPRGHPLALVVQTAGLTAAVAIATYGCLLPDSCMGVLQCATEHNDFPSRFNAYVAHGLALPFVHEVATLLSSFASVREARALVPEIRSRCLPSLLLATTFAILVAQHATFAASESAWFAHAAVPSHWSPIADRPVYTITYVEWLLNVPLLLIAAGYCALSRPMEEVVRPIALTNVYIVISWAAFFIANAAMRWFLVAVTFAMYGQATVDMTWWVISYYRAAPMELPSRNIRPCLTVGLILLFGVYGIIYLLAVAGALSAGSERMCWMLMDVGAKVAMSISFVAIRASEYHQTLTGLLKKVSTSNVAMVSILRGNFDMLLPCTVDSAGNCWLPQAAVADVAKFEDALNRPALGQSLADLLAGEEERERFKSYVTNTLHQVTALTAFGEQKLSAMGEWRGQAPPVAQVLPCRLATGGGDSEGGTVSATVHLSVVPQSSILFAREHRVMLAVRLGGAEENGAHAALQGFEEFDASEAMDILAGEGEGDGSGSPGQQSEGSNVIVASLVDMAKLGVSALFSGGGGGTSVAESESYVPSNLMETWETGSSVSAAHWGALARAKRLEARVLRTLRGSWTGVVSEAFGRYTQSLHFLEEAGRIEIDVEGLTLQGAYKVHCDVVPHLMDVEVSESLPQAASIRYIFKVEGDLLTLCAPPGSDAEGRPDFEGPGLCVLHRAASAEAARTAAYAAAGIRRATAGSRSQAASEGSQGASTDMGAIAGSEDFARVMTDSTLISDSRTWSRGVTEERQPDHPVAAAAAALHSWEPELAACPWEAAKQRQRAPAATPEDGPPPSPATRKQRGVHVVEFTSAQLAIVAVAATAAGLACLVTWCKKARR